MNNAKPIATPMQTYPPLTKLGNTLPSSTEYRSLVGGLQYLSFTRPDISFSVNKLAQYMQSPTQQHWEALKRLLRYLAGTIHHDLLLHRQFPSYNLHAFSDVNWACDTDDYISTTTYIVYFGNNPISWCSRKQKTRARSSTEAEYRALAGATAEILWLRNLFQELRPVLSSPPSIYCDNVSATYVSANSLFHSKMKHLALDYHFVRENVQLVA